MSRQPDNRQPEKKSHSEGYSEAKPINDRAAILVVVAGACGLVATWGGANNHHTTMTIAIIVGLLSFMLAGYLHWTPSKQRDNQTGPQLSLDAPLSQLVTEPSKASKEAPNTIPVASKRDVEASEPFKPFKGPIPFNALPPRWLKYTEDKFYKIIWHWHYTLEFDSEPHGVKPYCPECGREIGGYRYSDGRTGGYAVHIECKFHPSINYDCGYDDYAHIRKLIRQKIDDGSYDEVVTRLTTNRAGWISN